MERVTDQPQDNKALHPTAYSLRFASLVPRFASLRLSAAGELSRSVAARGLATFVTIDTGEHNDKAEIYYCNRLVLLLRWHGYTTRLFAGRTSSEV